jgi:hypothetical protein
MTNSASPSTRNRCAVPLAADRLLVVAVPALADVGPLLPASGGQERVLLLGGGDLHLLRGAGEIVSGDRLHGLDGGQVAAGNREREGEDRGEAGHAGVECTARRSGLSSRRIGIERTARFVEGASSADTHQESDRPNALLGDVRQAQAEVGDRRGAGARLLCEPGERAVELDERPLERRPHSRLVRVGPLVRTDVAPLRRRRGFVVQEAGRRGSHEGKVNVFTLACQLGPRREDGTLEAWTSRRSGRWWMRQGPRRPRRWRTSRTSCRRSWRGCPRRRLGPLGRRVHHRGGLQRRRLHGFPGGAHLSGPGRLLRGGGRSAQPRSAARAWRRLLARRDALRGTRL